MAGVATSLDLATFEAPFFRDSPKGWSGGRTIVPGYERKPVRPRPAQEGSVSSLRLRRAASVASSALLALMLLGPSAVSAATPTVDVGSLTAQTNTSAASPTTVSIGETIWFRTTLQNKDSSTISQLFLGVFSDATLYSYGTPVTYAATLTKNGDTVSGGCGPGINGAQVTCSVRNVKPEDTVQATFVLVVPATDANGDPYAGHAQCPIGDGSGYANVLSPDVTYLDGPATCVLSEWSSNGAPSSDGGSSHGDTWNFNDGVLINSDLTDFRSRWVVDQLKVENDQIINADNPHATTAFSPQTGIPVTVEDIDCVVSHYSDPDDVPAICATLTGFGEVSRVDVAGGGPLECPTVGDPHAPCVYHFMLKLDSVEVSSNPKGVNHVYPGGFETIVTKCAFAKGSAVPRTVPCITVKKLSGGDLQVDVWTLHNGGLRLF